MRGKLPNGLQRASFEGAVSLERQTFINSWDLGLPTIHRAAQRKIYTPRDAQPGDSGSALITDDGYLVGFAFERTPRDSPMQFCSWIWADSVFHALELQYPS
jgi:hypothetical protein